MMCIFVSMKISLSLILLVSLFFFSSEPTHARVKKSDPAIEKTFLDISYLITSKYSDAMVLLDSLEEDFLEDDYQLYSAYIDYVYGYIAYRRGKYEKSMSLTESALERFMYQGEDEWSARCLLLLANAADITRLIPEAIDLYEKVAQLSTSDRTLGAAYLGIARNRYRVGDEWNEMLKLGVQKYINSGVLSLELYARMTPYWFKPDSSDIVVVMPSIVKSFEEIGDYSRQADAYKRLAAYHQLKLEYEEALRYVDLAIATLNRDTIPSKSYLSSNYHLKGLILHETGEAREGLKAFNKAIHLNIEIDCKGNNYTIFQYLYNKAKASGNYQVANFYSERMLSSYRSMVKAKFARFTHLLEIFRNVEVVEAEVKKLKRHANNRIYVSSFLLVIIFGTIVFYQRSNNTRISRDKAAMETLNSKLMVETGDLLEKVNQEHHKKEIISNHKEIESKVERIFSETEDLSLELKEKYAETLLRFDVTLKVLTSTERRYAVMIVLGVPYKSIATLMSVQPGTVAQYRNRIRKKLKISNTETDLEQYLKTFL